jgi:hypothetical protein
MWAIAGTFWMSDDARLWDVSKLYNAPQWEALRKLASTALRMIESKNSP